MYTVTQAYQDGFMAELARRGVAEGESRDLLAAWEPFLASKVAAMAAPKKPGKGFTPEDLAADPQEAALNDFSKQLLERKMREAGKKVHPKTALNLPVYQHMLTSVAGKAKQPGAL